MLNYFTTETQVCIILVLVLLIVLASGAIGWRMGWNRCVEYVDKVLTERSENG